MKPESSINLKETLWNLFVQIDEGVFTEVGQTELNELLRQHPELIDDFIEYRERCASLRIIDLESREDSDKRYAEVGCERLLGETSLFPSVDATDENVFASVDKSVLSSFRGLVQGILGVVAIILIGLVVGLTFLGNEVRKTGSSPVIADSSTVVARLVAMDQCQWTSSDASELPEVGQVFCQGTMLKLESGLAQIHYESGVSLLFQGPGRLELAEPNLVCLHSGVVISRVSPEAIGFTVNTPGSKVIDHGTEFAVGVDKNSKTDVSVLEGKVELQKRQSDRASESKMLTAGQALRVDAKGKIELFRTIDPKRLAKNMTESDEVKRHNARVSIYRLRSASELKLKGMLVRAINVGSDEGIQVGDIYFEPDDPFVLDSSIKSGNGWGNRPWLGNAPEDKAICKVLHSIRYNWAEKKDHVDIPNRERPVSARLLVMPGRYRIRLLISENYHVHHQKFTDRSINLDIEGVPCLRDLRTLASQGIAGHPVSPNQALLVDVELDVTDGDLIISLFSDKVPDNIDPNVILNGLIIERLDN
jgi:FecR-like protein